MLAKLFGTSVDYLINGGFDGITVAGNIILDKVKIIEKFPKQGMLVSILSESSAVGGCVPNTAINLAKIDPSIPVSACGLVGDDEAGRYVTMQMQKYGINTSRIKTAVDLPTGYDDVMTAADTGARTFFSTAVQTAFSRRRISTLTPLIARSSISDIFCFWISLTGKTPITARRWRSC